MSAAPVVVIANPAAGSGRAGGHGARAAELIAQESGCEVRLLHPGSAGETASFAASAAREGAAAVVACGGDGTVHCVLQGLVGATTPFGILPAGTGDDIVRALGLPRDLDAAARAIAAALRSGSTRLVDIGFATTADGCREAFLGVLSTGFDSQVNHLANRLASPKGRARYLVALVRTLRTFAPIQYELGLDGQELADEGMLLCVANGGSYGGGMRVAPDADPTDGLLDVIWLHRVAMPTFLRVFPSVYRGTHIRRAEVSTHRARQVIVRAAGQTAFADGEELGPLPVAVEIAPGTLRILAAP